MGAIFSRTCNLEGGRDQILGIISVQAVITRRSYRPFIFFLAKAKKEFRSWPMVSPSLFEYVPFLYSLSKIVNMIF